MKRLSICLMLCLSSLDGMAWPASQAAQTPAPPAALGYVHVADALAALKKKRDAEISLQPDGWTVIAVPTPELTVWSFAPPEHEAYPAVARRIVKQSDQGGVYIEMNVLCEGAKASCARLVRTLQSVNERMRDQIRASAKPAVVGKRPP